MIKRYRLITNLGGDLKVNTTLVPDDEGGYVLYDDHVAILESIGAGGVSGRITQKTLEQHREEFEGFCSANGLNTKQDTRTGSGLFNSHVVGWMWKAWKAARGVTE